MAKTDCYVTPYSLATGTAATFDVDLRQARVRRLLQVCVDSANDMPPVHAFIHVEHGSQTIEVKSGWVRGFGDHGGGGGLFWFGELDLAPDPRVRVLIRNDTATTVIGTIHATVSKE